MELRQSTFSSRSEATEKLRGVGCSANIEGLALDKHMKCLSLVMGRKADCMGTVAGGLEGWGWKSGEVLFIILLFLVTAKSWSEDVEGVRDLRGEEKVWIDYLGELERAR